MFMFKGPISNNKENINIVPSPLERTWQTNFFFNFFDKHENFDIYVYEGPIPNNKENRNVAPGKQIIFLIS